jgi:hypothetical protein
MSEKSPLAGASFRFRRQTTAAARSLAFAESGLRSIGSKIARIDRPSLDPPPLPGYEPPSTGPGPGDRVLIEDGSGAGRFSRDSSAMLAKEKRWSNTGQTPVRRSAGEGRAGFESSSWPEANGQRKRSNTGQILVNYWPNTGQILVERGPEGEGPSGPLRTGAAPRPCRRAHLIKPPS